MKFKRTDAKFVRTDSGRSTSKRPKQKADCTVRAISTVMGFSYDSAFDLLASHGRKCSRAFDIEAWARKSTISYYRLGAAVVYWKLQKVPFIKDHHAKGPQQRYRIGDFLADNPKGRFILSTAGHVFAVVEGCVYDEAPWHVAENRPVYGWIEPWFKSEKGHLWQVYAMRRPLKKNGTRMVKRSVAIVEGANYKDAMRKASRDYEWAIRPNEDITVEPLSGINVTRNCLDK